MFISVWANERNEIINVHKQIEILKNYKQQKNNVEKYVSVGTVGPCFSYFIFCSPRSFIMIDERPNKTEKNIDDDET